MRFYIIGLGSMGKRRIRNLLSLGFDKKQIFGFDTDKKKVEDTIKNYKIKAMSNFNRGFQFFDPNILIISTPPDRHHEYFLFAAKHKIHFFSEISTTSLGYSKLLTLLDDTFVAAPSCTFRFLFPITKIKELLHNKEIGKPLFFNLYLGQYLPDWHWYEDYRKVYFSKGESGGCKEMLLYEILWLTYIFSSSLIKVQGFRDKLSDLEIEADDYYSAFITLENHVVGNVVIDLINRKAERSLKIIGSDGTLDWNWLDDKLVIHKIGGKIRKFKLKSNIPYSGYNTSEEVYISEMKNFCEAIKKKTKYIYNYEEDYKHLKLVEKFSKY